MFVFISFSNFFAVESSQAADAQKLKNQPILLFSYIVLTSLNQILIFVKINEKSYVFQNSLTSLYAFMDLLVRLIWPSISLYAP